MCVYDTTESKLWLVNSVTCFRNEICWSKFNHISLLLRFSKMEQALPCWQPRDYHNKMGRKSMGAMGFELQQILTVTTCVRTLTNCGDTPPEYITKFFREFKHEKGGEYSPITHIASIEHDQRYASQSHVKLKDPEPEAVMETRRRRISRGQRVLRVCAVGSTHKKHCP